jgi:hypothetical protein
MDATEFTATVRERRGTELDRLGSEKALVAATSARLDAEHVLAAATETEARAVETFEAWASDARPDAAGDADPRAAFERVADAEREHYERIVERLDDPDAVDASPDADAVHAFLRDLDDPVERVAAGMVARPMVASRSLLQTINFFVNEADESSAATFREIRAETDAMVDEGADLLESLCTTDEEWTRAEEAASETVARAYEAYAETLDGMGIDPKPVC